MTKILVIEDDEFKREKLLSVIREYCDAEFECSASVNSGMRKIIIWKPDLIILDMSLPTYEISADEEGGRPQGFGGREVLRQMERYDCKEKVLVVTQYATFDGDNEFLNINELAEMLKAEHPDNFIGLVYYDSAAEKWKSEIKQHLETSL